MSLRFALFLFLIAILTPSLLEGQLLIKGTVLDRSSREPIPYANIGIVSANIGTLSNRDGSFELAVPKANVASTLKISALGFSEKNVPVLFLTHNQQTIIYLNEKATVLDEIPITAKREANKFFDVGNPVTRGGVLETDTTYSGRSLALLIGTNEIHDKKELTFPFYLNEARLRIYRNNLSVIKFRIRLNEVDSISGAPGKDLLTKNIVVESAMKNGWLKFDLSGLNFKVSKPFFVTFEQITDKGARTEIADGFRDFLKKHPDKLKTDTVEFEGKKVVRQTLRRMGLDLPGTFIAINSTAAAVKYTSYVRPTSFGEWTKVRGIPTAIITVSTQPASVATATRRETSCKNDLVCDVQKLCSDFVSDAGINGMQVCVGRGNKIVMRANLGYADVVNKIAVNDSTRFRINSISKSLTSYAVAKLVSEGKLDLDAPIQRYLPDFPKKRFDITLREVLGHLGGIRDYSMTDMNDYIRKDHYPSSTAALAIIKNDSLLFAPNTEFHYSTFGFILAGAVIESVSRQNYLTYMKENVWVPLNLRTLSGDPGSGKISNRSCFYDATGNENDFGDVSYKYAGGGLLGSAEDLVKFGEAILNGTQLQGKFAKMLFETQHTTVGVETGYGLGWYTGKDRNGHRIWYHSGDGFSSSSYLILYPDDDLVVAFVANSEEGVGFNVREIGERFYSKP